MFEPSATKVGHLLGIKVLAEIDTGYPAADVWRERFDFKDGRRYHVTASPNQTSAN
jgi:hypothetical protein